MSYVEPKPSSENHDKTESLTASAAPEEITETVQKPETDSLEEIRHATSRMLNRIVERHTADRITIGDLMLAMHERGFGIFLIIFGIPNCIPVPAPPGYSTITSVPLFFIAVQMMLGMQTPWLPKWLKERSIERSTVALLVTKATPYIRKVEMLMHARMPAFTSSASEKIIGIVMFACALSILLPIPLSNIVPSYGILIMGLGLVSRDGLVVLIGKLVGFFGCLFTLFIVILGEKAVSAFLNAYF